MTKPSGQQSALRWIKDYLEQDYILDLPPSRDSLAAIKEFAEAEHVELKMQQRALRIHKKYGAH